MTATHERGPRSGFRHEALLYSTADEFVAGTASFIRAGLAAGEAVLAIVDAAKIEQLRADLAGAAAQVEFADMAMIGRNPALIMQVWRDFVSTNHGRGRSMRGVGEPISIGRDAPAIAECQIHEALLNLAFETEPDFWLLCPYDTHALPAPIIEQAILDHPFVGDDVGSVSIGSGVDHIRAAEVVDVGRPLPAPGTPTAVIAFGAETLAGLRQFVAGGGLDAGLDPERVADLVVAVSEIATNTVVHGRGRGTATMWVEAGSVVCEIRGPGHITDPLAGRLRPLPGQVHGYGLWLANQFCDLVQIRSSERGTTVRLHVRLA